MVLSLKWLESNSILSVLASLFIATSVAANPSTEEPLKGIAAHDSVPGAKQRVEQMYENLYEWEKGFVTAKANVSRGARSFQHSVLSRNFAGIHEAQLDAKTLEIMGEPAGIDLGRRYEMLRRQYRQLLVATTPYRPKELKDLTRDIAKRDKTIARCKELAAQGKLVEAEKTMRALALKTYSSLFYLADFNFKKFANPINSVHLVIKEELDKQRKEQFRALGKKKIESSLKAIEILKSETDRVVEELRSGSTVALGDQGEGDAAQAVAYIGKLWGRASAGITRSFGIAWAFQERQGAVAGPFTDEVRRAESIAVDGLQALIMTLEKATDADFEKLMPKVVRELAVIDRRYSGSLREKLLPAIEKVQLRHVDFSERARKYAAATIEPTRWMQRYASKRSETFKQEYKAPNVSLGEEREYEIDKEDLYGRRARPKRVLTPKQQVGHANWLAGDAKGLIGAKIWESSTVKLGETPMSVTTQDARHYSNLVVSFSLEREIEQLRESLLVDDSHPPLSYSAADAISAAERNEFEFVGGTVRRLTLEASVTRLATLPDVAHPLVPLNRLPAIDQNTPRLSQVMWRLDVDTDWVSHRMFVAKK